MSTPMHPDEVRTHTALVRRLLADQFPHWADLPIQPVASAGTDHTLYRLGAEMVVRMPRIGWATSQLEKEFEWLPRLAPHLPLSIPQPLAKGAPGHGYSWNWSVYRWMEGENATLTRLAAPIHAAPQLAQFVRALQRLDATGGPLSGEHNSFRGVPLAQRDAPTRSALADLEKLATLPAMPDVRAARTAREKALQTPVWTGAPVWVHGDLQASNLLATDGKLHAVIDFGCLGVGDPAVDLIVAWNLFSAPQRRAFRAALNPDAATWERGRGWALSIALVALPYYHITNPTLADMARYTIAQVLAEE